MTAYVVLTGGWDKAAEQVVLGPFDSDDNARSWVVENGSVIDSWIELEGELHGG